MNHDDILKYPLDRSSALKKYLEIGSRFFNVSAIHELRVEVKRLRAFYNCVAEIYPGFDGREEYRRIRSIFRAAGYLRDIHIRQELAGMPTSEIPLNINEYLNYLKQKEVAMRGKFFRAYKKFDSRVLDIMRHKVSEILKFHNGAFIEERLCRHFQTLLEKLITLGAGPDFGEKDFHQLRILSKETRYSLEVYQLLRPDKASLVDINEGLRTLHQVLGTWHDYTMAAETLQEFLQNDALRPLGDELSYSRLHGYLMEQKDSQRISFNNRWFHFIKLLEIHGYPYMA